jgi:hypothetical protein
MRRSSTEFSTNQQPQTGIGRRTPESLRVGSFKHPGGHDLPDGGRIPCLMLRGMWLDRFELPVGSRVMVEVESKRITLTLDETPIPVPYRYLDHTLKKGRRTEDTIIDEVSE